MLHGQILSDDFISNFSALVRIGFVSFLLSQFNLWYLIGIVNLARNNSSYDFQSPYITFARSLIAFY